jgi:BioD-like phosphotransacetylase family protein
MSVLYVASDEPGTGKTALCAALALSLTNQGKSATVFKPFASGDSDQDGDSYHKLLGLPVEGWPQQAPASGLTEEAIKSVSQTVTALSEGKDVTIVEGSNALSVEDTASLVNALDATAVLIISYRRDLTAADLSSWKNALGDALTGVVVNNLTQYLRTEADTNLVPTFEAEGMNCLGVIPESRRLLAVTAAQVAEHLNGKFITDEPDTDILIERFQVGGFSLDPGELRFGLYPDNAVVIRGDRPDVQMSALAVPVSCMVLTADVEPIEYVKYEAGEEGVPMMLVPRDTKTTMSDLNTVQARATFNHPRKLETFVELVDSHVNVATITAALGV